jgi:hypothetical protein
MVHNCTYIIRHIIIIIIRVCFYKKKLLFTHRGRIYVKFIRQSFRPSKYCVVCDSNISHISVVRISII